LSNDSKGAAREALQSYLSLPSSEGLRTIAAWKKHYAQFSNSNTDPRALDAYNREYEGLRKAGMLEGRRRRTELAARAR
jgi:hypothetical protein